MKFLTKVSLAAVAGGAGYYLFKTKQTPTEALTNIKAEINHKKVALQEFKEARQKLNESLANFKSEMGTVDVVSNQFQRELDEFMFIIQPHIDELNKYIDKLNNQTR